MIWILHTRRMGPAHDTTSSMYPRDTAVVLMAAEAWIRILKATWGWPLTVNFMALFEVIWWKRKGELQSSSTGKFLSSNVKQDTVTLLTCNVRHVSLCYRDVCVDRDGQCDGIKTNIFFVTKLWKFLPFTIVVKGRKHVVLLIFKLLQKKNCPLKISFKGTFCSTLSVMQYLWCSVHEAGKCHLLM